MHHFLVTGGAGFIGSNFIHSLLNADKNVQVVNLDALTYAGSLENLQDLPDPGRYTFIHGDINDQVLVDKIFLHHSIDTVVHFAAETHVDRSIVGPGQFIRTNINGSFTMLEAARHAWLVDHQQPLEQVRFHHVSSDEVFGMLDPGDPPFNENTPYAPNSPYAASKAASDHLVRAYFNTYGLPVTITNCSNNYGPRQFPEKLIPLVILNALAGKPLPVYGDGRQVRDWLYVDDHCAAIRQVLLHGEPGQTYIIGGGNQQPNLEVIRTICAIIDELRPDSPYYPHANLITFVSDRPGHDRRYAMDFRKIENELNWKPHHSLASGLRQTVTWYLENSTWASAIQQRGDYQDWLARNYTQRGG
jgi:dTDP-glucose 4,6-dehydratase